MPMPSCRTSAWPTASGSPRARFTTRCCGSTAASLVAGAAAYADWVTFAAFDGFSVQDGRDERHGPSGKPGRAARSLATLRAGRGGADAALALVPRTTHAARGDRRGDGPRDDRRVQAGQSRAHAGVEGAARS